MTNAWHPVGEFVIFAKTYRILQQDTRQMKLDASRSSALVPGTLKAPGRRHLLVLEWHEQWSVLGLCLTADDLAGALMCVADCPDADKLDLMVLAMRWLRQDARVCRTLQARLDALAAEWLGLSARCSDGVAWLALWEAGRGQNCAPAVYWALLSNAGTPPNLRRQLYRELGARYQVPMDGLETDTMRPDAVAEVVRFSGGLLAALKAEQERCRALSSALQLETSLRRQSQRREHELEGLLVLRSGDLPRATHKALNASLNSEKG